MKRATFFRSLVVIYSTFFFVGKAAFSAEDSVYDFLWLDPDKSVYVLQNKVYKKTNTINLETSFLTTLGKSFQDTYGADLKAQYYFSEHFGLEVFHTRYSNSDSDDFNNVVYVTRNNDVSNRATFPFVRRLNSATGVLFLVSPFYGKINTFNKIHYFDWLFGVGFAYLDAESNIRTVTDINAPNTYDAESYTALVYKTSFKFHTSRKWSFMVDLRNMNYMADGPAQRGDKKLRHNWDFMIGVGFKFN